MANRPSDFTEILRVLCEGDTAPYSIDGSEVRVLDMRRYLEFKEKSERPKDLAMVPVLRATLEERESPDD
ncbi:MAG: hypothetical protein ACLFVJ_10260 [Persicimonas sp.]